MLEYVHFVPGRLRLKTTTLKNQRRAAEAEANVAAIPMVTAAANPLTGSLTINFDRQQLSIGDLWEKLRMLGYVSENRPEPTVDSRDADRFGRVLAAALIEAVVQHSAQALVRALL
jgi:lysyl-tRNA synthetase class II